MNPLHFSALWLANQLHVEQPARWSSWARRLFVLPRRTQAWLPLTAAQVPDPLRWLARQLQLAPGASPQQWLLALFLRPDPSGRQDGMRLENLLAAVLRPMHQALAWIWGGVWLLLRPLLLLLSWPIRMAMRGAERVAARIDSDAFGRQADTLLHPLFAIPGMRWAVLGAGAAVTAVVMTTPLSWAGQLLFLTVIWLLSLVLRKLPGRFPSLALSTLSLMAMGRYAWWRMNNTLQFDSALEAALGYGLLAAEAYTWLIVILGFIQTAWPLQRKPAPLSGPPSSWPTVDVFIPTYNEPLSVVRPTVLAAMALDWPEDKLKVYILDDGRRDEFRDFANQLGVGYICRTDNRHAKAGNLNHALAQTDGELVAIFDCDHIPTRSFLKTAGGWFQRDPLCAMLQTPHHFFSPDPFERNLGTFRRIPNEGALFYGLIQDGNDFWNATFFCGSCAVLRRGPLMEVGGIAVETVTEDAHTALKLHAKGYNTAYINETQAAGLATESLSAHIGQRIRWARGMAQIFRLDNPFLKAGLSLWQRICYANAMLHFFFGLPRLVFLTAPMAYLFFELHIINTNALLLMLYVLPYILQTNIANAHVQGKFRHTFWAEVYETVLAWYIALPTTVALLSPRHGKFNVTAKGGLVTHTYFDWAISRPYMVLVLLNIAAFFAGVWRLAYANSDEPLTVLLNMVWTAYSIFMLGTALGVATESKQVRRMHRVASDLPATLYLPTGHVLSASCTDFSMSGLGLQAPSGLALEAGSSLDVGLWFEERECVFPARVIACHASGAVGLEFGTLSKPQQIQLVQCTFARPAAWREWSDEHDTDKPMQGLYELGALGLHGYRKFWHSLNAELRNARQSLFTSLKSMP